MLRKGKNHKKENKDIAMASQGRLIWVKFKRHKLAILGTVLLMIFYITTLFADFFSINNPNAYYDKFSYVPPQSIKIVDNGKLSRPYYYGYKKERDPKTLKLTYALDKENKIPLRFFEKGYEYELLGIKGNRHLIVADEENPLFLFGTDKLGRDIFSRVIYGARISLTIGLIGVAISFVIGCLLGGISGYYGGLVDSIIQRIIEFLLAIPTLPLWMALSAALPRDWPIVKTYFFITIILSITSWTGLARVVRGKVISIKNEDYVLAAKISGAKDGRIILRHLLPAFLGYLIVNLSMNIPGMILGETSLSFLGLGLQAPAVSWGVLLSEAQNVRTIAMYPWVMIPGIFVVIAVLAFNFVGDGLRDAADPYKEG